MFYEEPYRKRTHSPRRRERRRRGFGAWLAGVLLRLVAFALILFLGVISAGFSIYAMNLLRGKETSLWNLLDGFARFFPLYLLTLLMRTLTWLWMQLLIIFPMEGCWNEESGLINEEAVDSVPDRMEGQDEEYDGEKYSDDYSHLETFATPTPEPDSAAKEYDGWY